ncbi:potassium:proton antiporter [Aureococcus anophagefferens]|nr:potassium:proton antiporter [Aureococcus anophagefferens]
MSGYEEDAHAHHGHPGAPLAFLVLALFAGIFARTLLPKKLPYTVWLLGLGVVAGVVWDHEDAKTAHLGKVERMVLIFESAFNTDFHTLFNELGQILVLAVPGVVLGTAATACCARAIYLDGAGPAAAVASVAARVHPLGDGPVAVVALMSELGVAEIALTLAAAYGTFCLCEMVTVDGASFTSGVLALVALGVTLGARGREHGTAAAAHRLHAFWELAGFVANTSIFFVAGAMIASRVSLGRLGELCALYVALMAVRFAMLALLSPLLRRMGYGFGLPQFGALGWGALRGAVGLALALVVEENENIGARPWRRSGASRGVRELGERSDATLRDVVERDRYLGGADAAVVCQYLPVHDAATRRRPGAREVWGEERRVAAVLKAELWHLHHAGFVSADSLELLAEVCDVAVDRIFRLEKGPAGVRLRVRDELRARVRARGARRRRRGRVRGRLRDDVGKAEAWIGAYASAFPEMARTVKTEAAARVLLRREAANAEKLLRSGRIDCGERERFARKLAISERKCGLQYSGLVSFFDFLFTGHSAPRTSPRA